MKTKGFVGQSGDKRISSMSLSFIPFLMHLSLVILEGGMLLRLMTMVVNRGRWSERETSLSVETEDCLELLRLGTRM